MKGVTRLAARIFDAPLMISRAKAETILDVIGPKLRGEPMGPMPGHDDDEPMEPCDGIAIIGVHGTLVHRTTGLDAFSGLTSYKTLAEQFDAALADETVKGILLDVDSAGGEVAGVFDLADAIHGARGSKPVYAVADESCYSAAYAIASAADRIYVPRTAGVGSIGVIAIHRDQAGADEMNGYHYTTIFAGARKNDGNPHEPLSKEAAKTIQVAVDRTYGLFVDTVARNRRLSSEKVRATEAGLFFGGDAVAAGLADIVGTYDDALADLAAVAAKAAGTTDTGLRARLFALGAVPDLQASADLGAADDLPPPGTSAGPHPANAEGVSMSDGKKPEAVKPPEKPADTAQPAQTSHAAQQATVVDLDAARNEGEARALAYVRDVTELCAMVDAPEKAADFIAKKVAVADVRSALLAAKASKTDAGTISAHNPGAPAGAQAGDHGWGKVIAQRGQRTGGYSPAGLTAKR